MAEAVAEKTPALSAGAISIFIAAALIVCTYVALITARGELGIDTYKAFYCAGTVMREHGNPYTVEPLRACEHRVFASPIFPAFAVEPAPLPSYALAGFALLSLAPVGLSHALFVALVLAALFATVLALWQITKFPPTLLLLVCLPASIMSLAYGEIPPFAVAAIALCGAALEQRKPTLAAIFACAAMIQPHVALPLCLALFLGVPQTRVPLSIGAVLLAGVGLAFGGVANTVAYFTTYLPAHAASEVLATDQYSLTHVLHLAGVGDTVALRIGSLSYAVMAVLGIYAGLRLSSRLVMPALLAFTPCAFVLLGGSFVHDTQMYAATPLLVTLLARLRNEGWMLAAAATLLVVTWTQVESRFAIICVALAAFAIGLMIFPVASARVGRAAVLAAVVTAAVVAVNRLPAPPMAIRLDADPTIPPSAPASVAWNALLRSSPLWSVPSPLSESRKVPTWIGLSLLVAVALRTREEEKA